MSRRASGDGGLRWDETRQRWIAEITIGCDGRGKRIVPKASGPTKTEAKNKLRDMLRDQADGLPIAAHASEARGRLKSMVCVHLAPDCLMYSFNIGLGSHRYERPRWSSSQVRPLISCASPGTDSG